MHQQNLAILKGLICVAWADGSVNEAEKALLDALLESFAANPSEAHEVRQFAAEKRTLSDVPIHELSHDDRRVLLTQAVLLSFVDGEQHEHERALIDELCRVLRVPDIEAAGIIAAAEQQARALIPLLAQ